MSRAETVSTSLGAVPVKIVERGFEPLVVVMRGAFPEPNALEWLEPEGADTAFLHLPGFHTPLSRTIGVKAFAQAFDEVVQQLFPGRPLVLVGSSTAAVVALAMQAPGVRARVLIEPFFTTAQLWPLREWTQANVPSDHRLAWFWTQTVFGITPDGQEERDYRALLRPCGPIIAVVGDQPLQPPRRLLAFPSFAGEADRALLRAAGVEVRQVPGGHNLPAEQPDALRAAVADALKL